MLGYCSPTVARRKLHWHTPELRRNFSDGNLTRHAYKWKARGIDQAARTNKTREIFRRSHNNSCGCFPPFFPSTFRDCFSPLLRSVPAVPIQRITRTYVYGLSSEFTVELGAGGSYTSPVDDVPVTSGNRRPFFRERLGPANFHRERSNGSSISEISARFLHISPHLHPPRTRSRHGGYYLFGC